MKRGFNLLMAIFMLLLLSGLAVLTMKYASIHAKHFIDSYNKEQAQLFMDSVLEISLMRIEGKNRDGSCGSFVRALHFRSPDGKFDANVSILKYYLFNGKDNEGEDVSSCPFVYPMKTEESHGYVLMEINVSSTKHAKIENPIFIRKRTLQRP